MAWIDENLYKTVRKLIKEKHCFAIEVEDKFGVPEQRQQLLDKTLGSRREIYINLDMQFPARGQHPRRVNLVARGSAQGR